MKNKLIVILGPTASGKSSADSRQIYRKMDIGTAKISKTEGIPHYLINIVNPEEEFTLAQYKKMALDAIKDIQSRGKIPFLVGGTGLYIKAVIDNLEIPKVAPSQTLRKKLEAKTAKELFEDLKRLDPKTAEIIDSKNKRRLIRALEVKMISGVSFVSAKKIGESLFNNLQIGIKISREKLYKNIDQRVEEAIENGLESEVRMIYEDLLRKMSEGKIWQFPSLSSLFYQEFKEYFENKLHHRQYARRQMTWFKKDKRINWLEKIEEAEKLIKEFLRK